MCRDPTKRTVWRGFPGDHMDWNAAFEDTLWPRTALSSRYTNRHQSRAESQNQSPRANGRGGLDYYCIVELNTAGITGIDAPARYQRAGNGLKRSYTWK